MIGLKLSNQFTLIFQYAARAARTETPLVENKGTLLWNDVIILSINPSDYKITTVTLTLIAEVGMNYLQFEGNGGPHNGTGLAIANIQLLRKGTETNIVVNGDFKLPNSNNIYFTGTQVPGWKAADNTNIEIYNAQHYNAGWNSATRACELDSDKNYILTQEFNFDCHFNVIPAVLPPLKLIL